MSEVPSTPAGRRAHWDDRYVTIGNGQVSWHEPVPTTSLELLDTLGITAEASVIDMGGGASRLVDELVARGFGDLTVLDVSQAALDEARHRLGDQDLVTWLSADLLSWTPARRWTVWHDRAVFHFLTNPADRATYRDLIRRAVEPGGVIVVATFAPDGPEWCSGLPVRRYRAEELAAELGEGFEVLATTRSEHHTPAGAVQPFTWVALRA